MRHTWEEYKEYLERKGYSAEEIERVKEVRNLEEITKEQFDYLVSVGVIERTRKLKKIRSLFVKDNFILYLDHYHRKYNYCGFFKDGDN